MGEVAADLVLDYGYVGAFEGLDACATVVGDQVVLFDAGEVVLAGAEDAVVFVFLYCVVAQEAVAAKAVFGDGDYAVFVIVGHLVHHYVGVSGYNFHPCLALENLAALDLALVSFVDTDARAIDVVDFEP